MPVAVCANLPYYITSPIVMKLLGDRLPIQNLTVMVQKEAADRLAAAPGTRASSAISCAVSYYATSKLMFTAAPGSFYPAPKVTSAVVRMDIRTTPAVQVEDEDGYFALIRAAFGQRRKTAANAIASGLGLPKDKGHRGHRGGGLRRPHPPRGPDPRGLCCRTAGAEVRFYQNKTPRPPQSGTELRGPWSLCGKNGGWRSAYPQQCAVVCAAHGEAGGGAAVAEGERRIARAEGCNIGEGEGGSAAFGGEDNGPDALRAGGRSNRKGRPAGTPSHGRHRCREHR